jgi:hypothetical protein
MFGFSLKKKSFAKEDKKESKNNKHIILIRLLEDRNIVQFRSVDLFLFLTTIWMKICRIMT